MRIFLTYLCLFLFPLGASAQAAPATTLVPVADGAVITRQPVPVAKPLSAATAAQTPSAEAPKPQPAPVPETPATAATPASPESPPAPISKLWPRDTIPIFMTACTKFHRELIYPCRCIIDQVMQQMTHDEFLRLSETNQIDSDPRMLKIRDHCVAAAPKPQSN